MADSVTRSSSALLAAVVVLGSFACLTACRGSVGEAEGFARAAAREISANNHALDEHAVLIRLNSMYSQLGDLGDAKDRELLELSCQAKDKFDLSQVDDFDEASQWVAGKSKVPAAKARVLLQQLAELKEHPTLTGSGLLTVDAVCAVS